MAGEVALERIGECVVATLHGEIDLTVVDTVGEQLTAGVPNDADGLVVDLSNARYLDSAGIRMLFELVRYLGTTRRALAIVAPTTSPIRRLLTITKLDDVVPLVGSVDEGVRELRAARDAPID